MMSSYSFRVESTSDAVNLSSRPRSFSKWAAFSLAASSLSCMPRPAPLGRASSRSQRPGSNSRRRNARFRRSRRNKLSDRGHSDGLPLRRDFQPPGAPSLELLEELWMLSVNRNDSFGSDPFYEVSHFLHGGVPRCMDLIVAEAKMVDPVPDHPLLTLALLVECLCRGVDIRPVGVRLDVNQLRKVPDLEVKEGLALLLPDLVRGDAMVDEL